MDTIPKFLVSAFVIIIAVFIGISLIMSGTSITSAQSFYSNIADTISSVEPVYEEDMIRECTMLAAENNYVLKVEKHMTGSEQYYYELILEYDFVAPFFGGFKTNKISGYVYPGTHLRVLW